MVVIRGCNVRHTAAWKAHERRTARLLGGRRVGPSGTNTVDVDAGWLQVEAKHRQSVPAWLRDAVSGIRGKCSADQLGIVVLHQARAHDSYVILTLSDWLDWFGGAGDDDQDAGSVQDGKPGPGSGPDARLVVEGWG